jgi:REP element-mobilizing transposase RayT
MRKQGVFLAFCQALGATARSWFRVVQFSIQRNHLHFLVEADDRVALARGMIGVSVRLARTYNRVLGRRGKLWAERYHSRALRTPREVRHCLVYVLFNFKKHGAAGASSPSIDPCSSGWWFTGWQRPPKPRSPDWPNAPPVMPAMTWLAAVGWMRYGKIGFDEAPKAKH